MSPDLCDHAEADGRNGRDSYRTEKECRLGQGGRNIFENVISQEMLNFSWIHWPLHSGPCQIRSEGSRRRGMHHSEKLRFPETWVFGQRAGSKWGFNMADFFPDGESRSPAPRPDCPSDS